MELAADLAFISTIRDHLRPLGTAFRADRIAGSAQVVSALRAGVWWLAVLPTPPGQRWRKDGERGEVGYRDLDDARRDGEPPIEPHPARRPDRGGSEPRNDSSVPLHAPAEVPTCGADSLPLSSRLPAHHHDAFAERRPGLCGPSSLPDDPRPGAEQHDRRD